MFPVGKGISEIDLIGIGSSNANNIGFQKLHTLCFEFEASPGLRILEGVLGLRF